MALAHARDLYTRRGDPLSLWVVRSDGVHAASPAERDPFFSNARHKPYRYPEHFAPLTRGEQDDA
jgi:ring-1,2-phenylacetyl-CoA epoxidase subunit PaaB